MKTAIFTLSIGGHKACIPALLSAKMYAEKWGIDYFISDDLEIRFFSSCFEKFQGFKLFDMGYERVLFLDRDVLVRPDAPNIFEVCGHTDRLYGFDENLHMEVMDRDYIVGAIKGEIDWPINEGGKYRYFNAGIFIVSRNFKDFIAGFDDRSLYDIEQMRIFHEQTCLNYMASKKGVKFENFGRSWNWMDLGVADENNKRYQANFIHYAGSFAFVEGEEKRETIRKDFIHFYGEGALRDAENYRGLEAAIERSKAIRSEPQRAQTTKKYSIVFPSAAGPVELSSHLRYLRAEGLGDDCEILLIEDCQGEAKEECMEFTRASTRTIAVIVELEFEQLCTEIARQAAGEYVLFADRAVRKEDVFEAVRQLEESGKNVGMEPGRNYLIVRREAFLEAGGFIERKIEAGV